MIKLYWIYKYDTTKWRRRRPLRLLQLHVDKIGFLSILLEFTKETKETFDTRAAQFVSLHTHIREQNHIWEIYDTTGGKIN